MPTHTPSKRHLLVLGAGASIPFGFPSGGQLMNDLCSLLKNENIAAASRKRIANLEGSNSDGLFSVLRAANIDWDLLFRFGNDLRYSFPESIDLFLQNSKEYSEIGTLCIAYQIAVRENIHMWNFNQRISSQDGKPTGFPNWVGILWNQYLNKEGFFENNQELNIITFNYDRSLEFILWNLIYHMFRYESQEQRIERFKSFNIQHFYGSLGEINLDPASDNAEPSNSETFNYGSLTVNTIDNLLLAAKRIKIIGSQRKSTAEKIKGLVAKSNDICYLGFGFNNTNLNLLLEDELGGPLFPKNTKHHGTVLGVPAPIKKRLIKRVTKGAVPHFEEVNCEDFLRHHIEF